MRHHLAAWPSLAVVCLEGCRHPALRRLELPTARGATRLVAVCSRSTPEALSAPRHLHRQAPSGQCQVPPLEAPHRHPLEQQHSPHLEQLRGSWALSSQPLAVLRHWEVSLHLRVVVALATQEVRPLVVGPAQVVALLGALSAPCLEALQVPAVAWQLFTPKHNLKGLEEVLVLSEEESLEEVSV